MRLFLTLLALWAILVPTLCLAGAFSHACDDCDGCTDEPACAHEEECVEDPCSETMMRPAPGVAGTPDIGLHAELPAFRIPNRAHPVAAGSKILRPPDTLLPVPESDLPLLS